MARSKNTPWSTDKAAYSNKNNPLRVEIDEKLRELKRRKNELEHKRLVEELTKEVWE